MTDRRAIIASLKAQRANGARGSNPIGAGASPLLQQYQQWSTDRTYGSYLPRPPEEFLTGGFGPLTPIEPMPIDQPEDEGRPDPRRYVYRVGWNLPVGEPGTEGLKLADFNTLRTLADLYSVARSCIRLRKQEIRCLEWDIIPTPEAEKAMRGDVKAHQEFHERRAQAVAFFKNPDPEYGSFSSWIDAVLEEVLVFDALSLHLLPYWGKGKGYGLLGSDLKALELLSGPTIRPLVDLHGARPRAPLPAYQQYIYGVPRVDLTEVITQQDIETNPDLSKSRVRDYRGDQLIYAPYTKRTWTPYGFPPVEQALVPVITGLRKQGYQLDFYAEGTVPAAYISPGDMTMTPQQIRELQDALNAIAGDVAWKHKIIVLPPGSKIDPQKPTELADRFDDVIMTQVCMAFDVMPAELGLQGSSGHGGGGQLGGMNQMAKKSDDVNDRRARRPLLIWLKQTIFDRIIQDVCGQTDMQWTWEGLEEDQDEETQTDLVIKQIGSALLSIDEGRIELGKNPWGLPQTSDPGFLTGTGFTPIGEYDPVKQQPGPEPGDPDWAPPGQQPPSQPPGGAPAGQQPGQPTGGAAPAPGKPATATPGHAAGANTAARPKPGATNAPSVEVANVREAPVKKLHKGQLAELDALRRHVGKGRALDTWTPRHLDERHMETLHKMVIIEGEIPDDAQEILETLTKDWSGVAFDPTKHPRVTSGAGGGEFTSGASGGAAAAGAASALAKPSAAQQSAHQEDVMATYGLTGAGSQSGHIAVSYGGHAPKKTGGGKKKKPKKGKGKAGAKAKARQHAAAQRAKQRAQQQALRQKLREQAQALRNLQQREHLEQQISRQREMRNIQAQTVSGQAQERRLRASAVRQSVGKAASDQQDPIGADVVQQPPPVDDTWPAWTLDLALVALYAHHVKESLKDAVGKLSDTIKRWLSGAQPDAAQAVSELESTLASSLEPVLENAWTEAWYLGEHSAIAAVLGGPVDWGTWKPGDVEAARLVASADDLRHLLSQYGVEEIKSISDTYMGDATTLLHDALERGDSAGALAKALEDLVASPQRAQLIAQTEIARAMSAAAENRYRQAGVEKLRWVTALDERVCPICAGNEDAGPLPIGTPFPSGVPTPPGHPRCRCAILPAEPEITYVPDEPAYLGKCLTCGCDMPHNEHDDTRHFTYEELEAAAEAAGIPVDEAFDNLVHTYRHELRTDAGKAADPAGSAYEQMLMDYPPASIQWMHDAHWSGPAQVPTDSIDYSNAGAWQASHEPDKVERFKKKITKKLGKGKPIKPIVLVKTPKNGKFTVIDGHHRVLAYRDLGEPATAWVGHVSKENGPWLETHSSQYDADQRPTTDDTDAELYQQRVNKVGPKGYIHGWIYVGPQAAGAKVFHPQHGHGVVSEHSGDHVEVDFGKGGKHSFEARHASGVGELKSHKTRKTNLNDWNSHDIAKLVAIDKAAKEAYHGLGEPREDRALEKIAEYQGFDAKPIRQELDPNRETLYRGFGGQGSGPDAGKDYADQWLNGKYRAGTGIRGNGTYFTVNKDRAVGYGYQLETQLTHDARVAQLSDIEKQLDELPPGQLKNLIADDAGKLAALQGFDAIRTGNTVIVLNRGATVVKPEAHEHDASPSTDTTHLTQADREAANRYVQSSAVNVKIRNSEKLSQDEQSLVDGLDKAISHSTLNHDVTLYRGIRQEVNWDASAEASKKILDPHISDVPGDILTDPAFSSTSLSLNDASKFAFGQSTMLEIHAPAGSHALDMSHAGHSITAYEKEYLLPRNAKYRVTGSRVENGKKIVSVALEPSGSKKPTPSHEQHQVFESQKSVNKVGPHGYVHGWIKVGPDVGIADVSVTAASGKVRHRSSGEKLGEVRKENGKWVAEHVNGWVSSGHSSRHKAVVAIVEHHNAGHEAHATVHEAPKPSTSGWRHAETGMDEVVHPEHGRGVIAGESGDKKIILSHDGSKMHFVAPEDIGGTPVTHHEVTTGFRTSTADWKNDVTALHEKVPTVGWSNDMSAPEYLNGDEALGAILKHQGFDALPEIGNADAIAAAGGTLMYRGIAGKNAGKYAEEFKSGQLHPGFGLFGNGTYAAVEHDVASAYGGSAVHGKPTTSGHVMKMALKPDAKVAEYDDLVKMVHGEFNTWSSKEQDVFHDYGRYAAANGIDAIAVRSGGKISQYVILNRGKLMVDPK